MFAALGLGHFFLARAHGDDVLPVAADAVKNFGDDQVEIALLGSVDERQYAGAVNGKESKPKLITTRST